MVNLNADEFPANSPMQALGKLHVFVVYERNSHSIVQAPERIKAGPSHSTLRSSSLFRTGAGAARLWTRPNPQTPSVLHSHELQH